MDFGGDQTVPFQVRASPIAVTATQKLGVAQEMSSTASVEEGWTLAMGYMSVAPDHVLFRSVYA
jgi:hypothetical protein